MLYAVVASVGGYSPMTAAVVLFAYGPLVGFMVELINGGFKRAFAPSPPFSEPAPNEAPVAHRSEGPVARRAVSLVALPQQLHTYVASITNRAQITTLLRSTPITRLNGLFVGPPGTGKTEAIRWVSRQIDAELMEVDSDELMSCYLGQSEKNLAAVFKRAEQRSRESGGIVVVYIDEIDGLMGAGRHLGRSSGSNQADASGRLLGSLLQHMDRCAASADTTVIVIGSTNTPDHLDPALRRRFHRKIEFPLPNDAARTAFFADRLQQAELETPATQPEALAADTGGLSFADLDQIVQEAAECAVAAHRPNISNADFRSAISTVRRGKVARNTLREPEAELTGVRGMAVATENMGISKERQRLALITKQYHMKRRMAALDAPNMGWSARRRAHSVYPPAP